MMFHSMIVFPSRKLLIGVCAAILLQGCALAAETCLITSKFFDSFAPEILPYHESTDYEGSWTRGLQGSFREGGMPAADRCRRGWGCGHPAKAKDARTAEKRIVLRVIKPNRVIHQS